MIHTNSGQITFRQGFIAQQMNEPITVRSENNSSFQVIFLYGDVIDVSIVMGGQHDTNNVSPLWWEYIRMLMHNAVFNEEQYKKLERLLIGVYEKNGFETKG